MKDYAEIIRLWLEEEHGIEGEIPIGNMEFSPDLANLLMRLDTSSPAHKAQVRGMVEEDMRNLLRKRLETTTQRVLAVELGVSCQYVNDIVHGRRGISDEVAATMGYSRQLKYTPLARQG